MNQYFYSKKTRLLFTTCEMKIDFFFNPNHPFSSQLMRKYDGPFLQVSMSIYLANVYPTPPFYFR